MANILIIEDETLLLENLKFILELEGYSVQAFDNGLDGIEYSENNSVDLIICDINMDGIDGFKVLERVRSNLSTKNTPFIFLTARSSRDDIRFGMNLGADDYIPKPYTNEMVINAVKSRLIKYNEIQNTVNEEINLSRRNLASTLPHELKTPLSIIMSYTDVLKNSVDSLGTNEILEIAEIIDVSANRLHRMFNNFTYYIELFDFKLEDDNAVTLNPNSLIKNSIFQFFHKKIQSLILELDNNIYEIKINKAHFKKIIEELVDNALKFSDDASKVIVRSRMENNQYFIEVSNTGVEFRQADIRNIGAFKQFNRAFQEQQGMGLGLGIVKKIMDIYNYDFEIKSNSGYTVVKLYFPVL